MRGIDNLLTKVKIYNPYLFYETYRPCASSSEMKRGTRGKAVDGLTLFSTDVYNK
ncbi:hypothetical protein KDA_20750 [Dictyobacter alpinus]|uniref:Uncharacterized protein n=1 Tax=Dictyobacter alpinus TaxID=2014873 RepID=A0A402B5G1_9CHLR|nr:hypothetical protein KDA_20750 [Dictyobacter alpinus]